jgi:hypothetical protein
MFFSQGASPRELVLEAARRNNTDLLQEVLNNLTQAAKANGGKKAEDQIAELLNNARDGIGNGVLHLAALNGNCEIGPAFIRVLVLTRHCRRSAGPATGPGGCRD